MSTVFFVYVALYALTGTITGILAGLLGVGGGLIIVPALSYLFDLQGIPSQTTLHLALGTSLGTIVMTSVSSTRAHHQRGGVDWQLVLRITPGILVGTFIGGLVAAKLATAALKLVFSVFLLAVAAQMISGRKPRPTRALPGVAGLTAVGAVIGGISGLVGIGGGTMSVPFMLWCNVEMRRAVGTSAAIGFPIAISGALSYLYGGLRAHTGVDFAIGYLHLPALVCVALGSVITAPFGASLASRLDPNRIKRVFACLLIALSLRLLWGVLVPH